MSNDPVSVSRIRFETEANLAGAQQAERALDGVAKKAQDSGAATAAAGKAGAVGMQTLGQTAAAASGNVSGVAGALGGLSRGLPGLQQATVYAGAAGAAFAAWARVVQLVSEAARRLREDFRKGQSEELSAQISRHADAYARMTKEMDAAAAARKALSQAEQEAATAEAGYARAKLEAEREAAKARLAPDDELGRRQIDLQYGAQISAVDAGLKAGSVQRKREGIREEQADQRTRQQQAIEMRGASEAAIREELARFQELSEAQNAARTRAERRPVSRVMNVLYTGSARNIGNKAASEFDSPIKDSSDRQTKLVEQLQTAQKTIEDTQQRLAVLELNMDAARMEENAVPLDAARERSIQMQAAGKLSFDQTAARKAADASAVREQAEAAREQIRMQRETAQGKLSQYDAAVTRERGDVSAAERTAAQRPRGRLGHSGAQEALQQQLAELEAAMAARDSYNQQLLRVLADLKKREEALAEQMKRQ